MHTMHSAAEAPLRRSRIRSAALIAIVGLIVVGTACAMAMLWPAPDELPRQPAGAGATSTVVTARVTSATMGACGASPPAAGDAATSDAAASAGADTCLRAYASLPIGQTVTFSLDPMASQAQDIRVGDTVRLIASTGYGPDGGEPVYAFYDHPRGGKMLAVAIGFALVVVAVGRVRGALALAGVGIAVALLATFVLPAILAGRPAIPVAIVGAVGIMTVVLYLAHGISHRTTAALFGSIFGILFTAVAGVAVTHWLRFSGIASTEEAGLLIAVPGLRMNDLLTATIVIAGLGVLNDITVAQASAVWEMRALNPGLEKRRISRAAMRIGRDHIASSIYTLVFAYTGAMLVVLLLVSTQPRDLVDLVTSEQIAQEIIRTLIGAAGLVLSMPVTTACAVLFVPAHDTSGARLPGA